MKKQLMYIAMTALLLPLLIRGLWFYRGIPNRPEIATPDFASFSAPQAPIHSNENTDAVKELGGTVLIDTVHGNQFSMAEIDSLTSAIQQRGGKIEMTADLYSMEYQLKYASAFITFSPTLAFTTYESQLLKNFTDRGGKVLVFTDATRNTIYVDYYSISPNLIVTSDANAANTFLRAFDITINSDYLYNTQDSEGNFRNVFFDEFGKSELTFGLTQVALYGTHSVESPSGLILLRGTATNLSSSNDANDPNQGGAAMSADGNVVAFGDVTFLSSPYNTYTDNATLISNLADFALTGTQSLTLQNFPYVFESKTVSVYLAPDLTKDSSMITALSSLQTSLRFMNIEIEFVDSIPSSGDTIIISTFTLDDKTQSLANKFDIEFGFSSITTTEFGDVSNSGTGIILLDATNKGTTLILLAGSPEDVIALIGVAGAGNINSCLTSAQVAACSVGYGDVFFEEPLFEETPLAESGSIPEATPTP